MVPLAAAKRASLRGYLISVLHDAAKDALAEMGGPARAAPADCVVGMMDAVLSATHEALIAFAQQWNSTQASRLAALPPELASAIFRQLDFAGRLAVSHVCSSWRRVALADRILWAEYSILKRKDEIGPIGETLFRDPRRWNAGAKASLLSLLLERSSPMPFALTAEYVPDAIVEVVTAHANRMETLKLGVFQSPRAAQDLLQLDLSALRLFFHRGSLSADAPLAIPPRWADSLLEHLDVTGRWLWPAGCVFQSLHTFCGTLPESPDGTWRLADLVPNVKELHLIGMLSQADLDRLDPLPCALTSMKVVPLRDADYASLFRNCKAFSLRRLHIGNLRTAASLEELFALFLRTCSGHWALRIDFTQMVLSSVSADPACEYRVSGHVGRWLSWSPRALASWARVCDLAITLSDLLGLWSTLRPGASLPSLRKVHVWAAPNLWGRAQELENGTRIASPTLASVSVSLLLPPMRLPSEAECNADMLSVVAPIVRAFRAPALEDVVIETDDADSIERDDVLGLVGLTKRVTARNRFLGCVMTWNLVAPAETQV